MKLEGIAIDDTFAEAFGMRGTRLVITADSLPWAEVAGRSMTGFATSVIGCGLEAGIERALVPEETPDGRPGIAVLLFAVSRDALAKALRDRVGQFAAPIMAVDAKTQPVALRQIIHGSRAHGMAVDGLADSGSLEAGKLLAHFETQLEIEG